MARRLNSAMPTALESIGEQLLELLPTSSDLRKLRPDVPTPKFNCRQALLRCGRFVVRQATTAGTAQWSRIRRHPNQSVATCFLIGMLVLYVNALSHSKTRSTTAQLRTSTMAGMHELDETLVVDHAPQMTLPSQFNYVVNRNQTVTGKSTPVLWFVPRSGGNTVAQILGECQGMVLAGAWQGGPRENLEVVFDQNVKQVTADLTTKEGRTKARDQGLRDVHPHIVLLSSNLFDTSDVFAGSFQAELWTWFRHPIERQISTYFFLRSLQPGHPGYDPRILSMSLTNWAQSNLHVPNAMLASLLGIPSNPMGWTEMDLMVAKNLLRTKARIGLLERKTESLQRFLAGQGKSASGARECQERLLDYAWTTKIHHDPVGAKSDAFQLLVHSNSLDIRLYDYAKYLFELQGRDSSRKV